MWVQPMAGMVSDRSTSRWGRRRPFIFSGALLNLVFLLIIAASPLVVGTALDRTISPALGVGAAYLVLLVGIVLLQVSSNLGHGALQGLIPDLVPEDQRGRSSGVKAVMELLPIFLVLVIGPLVDSGRLGVAIGIVMGAFVVTMLITVLFVHEQPLRQKPAGGIGDRMLRLAALTAIFVIVTRVAVWFVGYAGRAQPRSNASHLDVRPFGKDRVHVRREQQRLRVGDSSSKMGDEVADITADLFAGIIHENGGAQFFHLALEAQGDIEFLAR
jgi:MFS family permease